ncbi:universal stress protein [Streptomyces cyanogenus]|uniref:Universal stress protein n=1 Tax=Streptomyces cyanogenus TaxID=80860 RepID=A0ABX7U1S1_STRCY|nr:universal stress protein [Streptomyces cyanogenus]QTE02978.1 Universal stress protein [Streptomyces cyanogenus]
MSTQSDRRPIVVGVEADPAKRMALAWAADEAARRHLPLRPVRAEGVPTRGYRGREVPPSWEEWNDELHHSGKQVLSDVVDFVGARHPEVEVDAELAEGDPVWVLCEQSRHATAVVLGSQHLSRAREMYSSASVVLPVMAHAHCPVVVVPEPEHVTQEPEYYVVGVDGSEHAAAAVDLAFEEAALRRAELRALYVWQPGPLKIFDEHAAQQECRRLLSETVAGRRARYPEADLRHELVVGHPVQVLTEASTHALGLVVGTRGRGGFTGMLLGSVSQGVLHHARCPVIAVPTRA